MAGHVGLPRLGPGRCAAPAAGDRQGPRPGGRAGVGDRGDGARQPRPGRRRAPPAPPGRCRRAAGGAGLDDDPPTPGRCPVTAAVTAPARVPGQAGPPAIEQSGPGGTWDLVVAAQAGDRDAYGQLYARYRDPVFRFVYFRCGNRQVAEDLTSDTFVRALRRIESVQWQGRDIGAWFVTIARNLVADHFKSGRYRLEVTVGDFLDVDRTDGSREGDPARAAVDYLTNVELLTAVQSLTAEQQDVVVLRFLHGLSVAETAAATGKNEGAVKAVQYRAMRALAQRLPAGFKETR
ncbi:sigma-70 family RNA polymerase sigma factor [Micromonospora fulviviridis]|uniref:sigma-70 family RNA polymerase sigma factor n=1 Tax=Micromonospora fulviviridis TaxID=47860 RepID=UPI00378E41B8